MAADSSLNLGLIISFAEPSTSCRELRALIAPLVAASLERRIFAGPLSLGNGDVAGSVILIIRGGFSPTADHAGGVDFANAIDLQNNVTLNVDTGSESCAIIKNGASPDPGVKVA